MGVKDLMKVIKKNGYKPNIVQLSDLSGKIAAIDGNLYMYKFSYGNNNIILSFLDMIYKFVSNGIYPIFIFDGIAKNTKTEEIERRKKVTSDRKQKISEFDVEINKIKTQLINIENTKIIDIKKSIEDNVSIEDNISIEDNVSTFTNDVDKTVYITELESKIDNISVVRNKLDKCLIELDEQDFNNVYEILDILNIQYTRCNGFDAEGAASKLCKNGIVDFVVSNDTDCFPYGSLLTMTNYKNNETEFELYNLVDIINTLGIYHYQFIDLCILLGTDYNNRIPGQGPVHALKNVKAGKALKIITDSIQFDKYINIHQMYDFDTIIFMLDINITTITNDVKKIENILKNINEHDMNNIVKISLRQKKCMITEGGALNRLNNILIRVD